MENRIVSGGTNFHAIFETANRAYDRIIILSDMQGWVNYNTPTRSFAEYKRRVGANPRVYSFDLQA
jgi:60 kDa SS-A/Ro ribonucleoprotein